ncbi:MAG TPA: hypothetical protein VFW07_25050 [Parafilimonas sp.]|nr:hypothetical protein [Parafilimonas sp.]
MFCLLIKATFCLSQEQTRIGQHYSTSNNKHHEDTSVYIITNPQDLTTIPPTCIFAGVTKASCKEIGFIFIDTAKGFVASQAAISDKAAVGPLVTSRTPLLTIHGNVAYDFYYQSHLDTPYYGDNLYQHTISTFLDVRIKDDYPLRVYFTTRFGNTNYLRNITNLNFQYSPQTFQNIIKSKLRSAIDQQPDTSLLGDLQELLQSKMKQLQGLQQWMNSPSMLQKLVEEREANYIRQKAALNNQAVMNDVASGNEKEKIPVISSLSPLSWLNAYADKHLAMQDSIAQKKSDEKNISEQYAQKKKKLDSIKSEISLLQQQYLSKKDSLAQAKNILANAVNAAHNPSELKELLNKSKLPDSILPKGYDKLLSIKKFGVGTSTVDYSELSAKNITIRGLQLEYNSKYYYAIAGGVINYRFRDYLLPESHDTKQYLGLARFGKETRKGSSLIFTYYFGKKVLYNYYTTDSSLQSSMPAPGYGLMGITLENKIKLNANSYLTAEVAKSSIPYYHSTNYNKGMTGTFNMSDRSNEAYSLKINAAIPVTHTRFEGYFKHYGANFQSFTLISTSSEQNAWLFKIDQQLLKNQLSLTGVVRKNDYINPFVDQRYVSNTVFKSVQGTLHIKNLPVISAGFFPVTQLAKLNNDTYMENMFYTLTANVSYYYNKRHTGMNTTMAYMQFYNRPSDSGFVYFNSANVLVNHAIYFKHVTLQTSFSNAANSKYTVWALGQNAQIQIKKWLTLGGSVKYNKENIMVNPQIGYGINTNIQVNKFGNFQVRVEKTYIPSMNNQLVANNIGRFTFYRNF